MILINLLISALWAFFGLLAVVIVIGFIFIAIEKLSTHKAANNPSINTPIKDNKATHAETPYKNSESKGIAHISKGEKEFIALAEKFNKQIKGKTTYHMCDYCIQLAMYYMRGKYVEKDTDKAALLCDSAIEYASVLYSKKTRDRKVKEFKKKKKDILNWKPLVLDDSKGSIKKKVQTKGNKRISKHNVGNTSATTYKVTKKKTKPKANISKHL